MKQAPKSNTWVVVVPTLIWFGLGFAYDQWWQAPTSHRYDQLLAAGFGIPFVSVGVAQLRSRYIWKNLRPGNRGAHQIDEPRKFVISTTAHFFIGFGIALAFGLI